MNRGIRGNLQAFGARGALSLALLGVGGLPGGTASAQDRDPRENEVEHSVPGDIIVTARRREETLTNAPLAVSAVSGEEIARRGIARLDNLVQSVPQLVISDAGASTQGGLVMIRGIGVGESNPFADQAVSFNIDGCRSAVRTYAECRRST